MDKNIKTQSSNWDKVKELLEKGKIEEAEATQEEPTNEKLEYSVIVKQGYTWGATWRYHSWFNIQEKQIPKEDVLAWQVHKKIQIPKRNNIWKDIENEEGI